jgi:predicted nucleotidyltransferase component of viral defense system
MGGTAIRITHGSPRFSEDLDFDNRGLDFEGFCDLITKIGNMLTLEGYPPQVRNVSKGAYRSYLKIPALLFDAGLSAHKTEKLTIQLDMEPQGFEYTSENIIINKFDVFARIRLVPVDILLAQKITCIFTRKRAMGRDFFDTVFLLAKTKPNYAYLKQALGITDSEMLRQQLQSRCQAMDFQTLTRDVTPFLYQPDDADKVALFPEYIKSASL